MSIGRPFLIDTEVSRLKSTVARSNAGSQTSVRPFLIDIELSRHKKIEHSDAGNSDLRPAIFDGYGSVSTTSVIAQHDAGNSNLRPAIFSTHGRVSTQGHRRVQKRKVFKLLKGIYNRCENGSSRECFFCVNVRTDK